MINWESVIGKKHDPEFDEYRVYRIWEQARQHFIELLKKAENAGIICKPKRGK